MLACPKRVGRHESHDEGVKASVTTGQVKVMSSVGMLLELNSVPRIWRHILFHS